jgi:hypothetical protein
MKKLIVLLLVVLAAACQNDPFFRDENITPLKEKIKSSTSAGILSESPGICNEKISLPLMVDEDSPLQGPTAGRIEWVVEPGSIHIDFFTEETWYLTHASAWIGRCEESYPDPADFPLQQAFAVADDVHSFSMDVPITDGGGCRCLILRVEVASWFSKYGDEPSLAFYEYEFLQEYCPCEQAVRDDKLLRTQTQGGWGSPPHGNNPGAYLQANFAAAFPEGLVVGCTHTLTLTTAEAVRNFLPQGGKPAPLSTNYVDPARSPRATNNLRNVLAGQVVALTLSIGFDAWDENFGETSTKLRNAVVTEGIFQGWTVAQVLAEAEKVLGGCSSPYSASQLNEVLSAINESFIDGKTSTGFLMNSI